MNAVVASLELFNQTSMAEIRKKSLNLTRYLEHLLCDPQTESSGKRPFIIITPSNPAERGAQLSIRLQPGLLDRVLESLDEDAVIIDERKPDVIRVAPAPLYNTYVEVWRFAQIFHLACDKALRGRE
jgi:kynureninase